MVTLNIIPDIAIFNAFGTSQIFNGMINTPRITPLLQIIIGYVTKTTTTSFVARNITLAVINLGTPIKVTPDKGIDKIETMLRRLGKTFFGIGIQLHIMVVIQAPGITPKANNIIAITSRVASFIPIFVCYHIPGFIILNGSLG